MGVKGNLETMINYIYGDSSNGLLFETLLELQDTTMRALVESNPHVIKLGDDEYEWDWGDDE